MSICYLPHRQSLWSVIVNDEQREKIVEYMAKKFELLCTGQVFADLSKRPQGSDFNNADHRFYAPVAELTK